MQSSFALAEHRPRPAKVINETLLRKGRLHTKETAWLVYGLDDAAREEHENCFEGCEFVAEGL